MKNLVVCCDGTGNEISENISNVLKLYRMLRKTDKTNPRQVAFYDPGVGTLARPDPWTKLRQDAATLFGLATGYGLDDNILRAYGFLVRNYEEGDGIFLFGFSRGAYTVRVLAAFIHKVGLLAPEQLNLVGAALAAYKETRSAGAALSESTRPADGGGGDGAPPAERDDPASQFARIVSSRWPTVAFLGVWDTVASIVVPRPGKLRPFSLQRLPFTRANSSVKVFRQAMAIDERRRMFRLEPWDEPQSFMHNRFSATNNSRPQDSLQVWFAGVHADVGGGYPERESGLSKFPLLWMVGEAAGCGLSFNTQSVNQLGWGVQRHASPFSYVAPDVMREPHRSMTPAWRVMEWLPKSDVHKEWTGRRSLLGHYIPDSEPRVIAEDARIHQSVFEKMDAVRNYAPVNLPHRWQVEPGLAGPKASR